MAYGYYGQRRRSGCGCASVLLALAFVLVVAAVVAVVLAVVNPEVRKGVAGLSPQADEVVSAVSQLLPDAPPSIAVEDIQEDGLAFATLSNGQKVLYQQLLDGVRNLGEAQSFEVHGAVPEDIDGCYHAVLIDHPELFWVDGSTRYTYFREGGAITITPGMTLEPGEIEHVRAQVEAVADGFLASIPADADDYAVAKLAYEFVIETTDYDAAASQNQNVQSVFLGHASVCAGYARAFQYLLHRAGIPCSFVEGRIVSTGEDHAWNIALLDGAYTYVDPTWGDPTYLGLDDGAVVGTVYDYLGLTTEEILRDDHAFDDESMWPACDSSAASYYVREGLAFEVADEAALSEAFWRQQAAGAYPLAFKFTNEGAYAEARGQLAAGEFLLDDLQSLYLEQGRTSTSYQYQYEDALHILKLFL